VFSTDGKTLACIEADGRFYLWEVATRKELPVSPIKSRQSPAAIAASPDLKLFAFLERTPDGIAYDLVLWNVPQGRELAHLPRLSTGLNPSLAWSPDGKNVTLGLGNSGGPGDMPSGRDNKKWKVLLWNVEPILAADRKAGGGR
jgi:WD40 repeat protein